jgi:hypothetical protein
VKGRRASAVRVAIEEGVPDLHELFRVPDREFGSVHYALAWCLAKVLCDLERDRPGRLREALQAFGPWRDPWEAFGASYPAREVEALWRAEVQAAARTPGP